MSEDLKQEEKLLFSIVIITRNRAGILGDCLDSMVGLNFPKGQYELVVVDDGSTDGTADVARSYQAKPDFPAVRYVAQSHQGVNAARNTGVENAWGENVVFLDDDELAPVDYLSQVWQLLSKNPDFDGVGGPVVDYGGSTLRTCGRCSLADADKPGEGKRFVPILLGGNMALRAGIFKKVGLFDPEISGRGDESEWFHRAKGHKFFQDPDLWVWHRRDNFSFWMLCRHSLVQGLSVPLSKRKRGLTYRPRPRRIIKPLAHAVTHRCTWGLVRALRETGAVLGYIKLVITGR